jgi:hypothetical protein
MLSCGLGLVFVPVTLTAVAGVAPADSGVGSAVLNTMQQIGGSLGLATLSTVSVSASRDRALELAAAAQTRTGAGPAPGPEQVAEARRQIALAAQTFGATRAFLVASAMVLGAAVLILVGLNVRYSTLANDGRPRPVD